MKIWMVRHGESETNKKGLWSGWFDAALTEKGKEDAVAASKTLSGVRFDKIYSSDLARARNTADIAIPGCKYETTPMIREISVGSLERKPFEVILNSDGSYANEDGYAAFGGESNQEFSDRILSFMKQLESENCENIAVFAHGGVIKKFFDLVAGFVFPRKSLYCGNCAIVVFEYIDQNWRLHSWINLKEEKIATGLKGLQELMR